MLRIGLGHDTHRLIEGSFLLLGGVRVEHDRRLDGHSDSDVLLHAVTDALLGAAGLEDIGEIFPDTDPQLCGIDSAEILRRAWNSIAARGWKIVNLDTVVFAERPMIAPHKERIRANIARILDIGPDRVGVKAKTGEKVGPVGREEAVCAECVVLLESTEPIS